MSTGLKRGLWAALLLSCLGVGAYALRGAFAFGEPPITAATPSPAAAAAAAATVVFRIRFVGAAPDISPDPCRTSPLIAVNRRSP